MPCSEADVPRGDCGDCRGRSCIFAAVRTLGPYQGALRQAVLKIKHARYEPLAMALGQRLAEHACCQPLAELPELVVPVPMHWLKRLWRQTNPAETRCPVAVAGELGLPLRRRRARLPPLASAAGHADAAERRQNVRGAFRASRLVRHLTGSGCCSSMT